MGNYIIGNWQKE